MAKKPKWRKNNQNHQQSPQQNHISSPEQQKSAMTNPSFEKSSSDKNKMNLNTEKMSSSNPSKIIWIASGALVVILALVLAFVFGKKDTTDEVVIMDAEEISMAEEVDENDSELDQPSEDVTKEVIDEENAEAEVALSRRERRALEKAQEEAEQNVTIEESVDLEVPGTMVQSMQAVPDGEFNYRFDSIMWEIIKADEESVGNPVSQVSFRLNNFTRREEGTPIVLQNPFKLGAYSGSCIELDQLSFDASSQAGIPLAFAECAWQGKGYQFAIYQEGNLIVAKRKALEESLFQDIGSYDMLTLVQ